MNLESVAKIVDSIAIIKTPSLLAKPHHLPNGRFTNPWVSAGKPIGFFSIIKHFRDINWKRYRSIPPINERVPVQQVDFLLLKQITEKQTNTNYSVTWLGHSSFLIVWNGVRILTDPVLSQRCSPFSFLGPKRYTQPAVELKNISDMFPIDLVLISHCHYDHLDAATIKAIGNQAHYIVPLKTSPLLTGFSIKPSHITELDWHEQLDIDFGNGNKLQINCTPAQHGSARWFWDRDAYLWCSYVVQDTTAKFFFAGDTGYRKVPRGIFGDAVLNYPHNPEFKAIGDKFKDIDVALLPIGAYSPKHVFSLVHADPYDAACIFKDIKAKKFHPMHYGSHYLYRYIYVNR